MIASFAVSTIEDLVDLFYRRSDELSFDATPEYYQRLQIPECLNFYITCMMEQRLESVPF